jgi:proline iminopeptidase
MIAKVRDTELFFDVEGSIFRIDGDTLTRKPVLLALHGGPGGDHTTFRPTLSALVEEAQIIYVDQRGSGRSARGPRESYTLKNNVADIEALRRYLGVDRIALLGYSYGGMVAMSYAIEYPESLSHLIVVASAPSYQFLDRAKTILHERGTPRQIRLAQQLWNGSFRDDDEYAQYQAVLRPLYSVAAATGVETSANRPRGIVSHEPVNEAFSGFLRTFDVRRDLPQIQTRTLVVGAAHDWICAPEFSAEIAASIPQAELHILRDSGHKIFYDQPDSFLGITSAFLRNDQQ